MAVCRKGSPRYPLEWEELVVHELDVRALGCSLCRALGLDPAIEPVQGVHQTWQLGFWTARAGASHPVYLMIQQDPTLMPAAMMQICLGSSAPFALLLPTASMLSPESRRFLESRRCVWVPLDKTVHWSSGGEISTDLRLSDLFDQHAQSHNVGEISCQPPPADGQVVLGRREMPDGIHWIVNGEDRGVFFKHRQSIKAKIIEILFEQLGHDWVPHSTFIHACGWSGKRYFGESSEPKLIQKHLTDIRTFLGVEVNFRKELGVRFGENVVKSRK